MKDLTTAEMEIKMAFPDMEKMVVEFDVVFSRQEVERKGMELAACMQTCLLRYEHRAKSAVFYFSQNAKDVVENLKDGQEVYFIQRDVAGNIVSNLCRVCKVATQNKVVYMGGDACIRVESKEGKGYYTLYSLSFEKGGEE